VLGALACELVTEEAAALAAARAAPADAAAAEALLAVRLALFYACLLRAYTRRGHFGWRVDVYNS